MSALPLQELLEKEKNAVTMQMRMSGLGLISQRVRKVKVILKSVDKRLGKVQVRAGRTRPFCAAHAITAHLHPRPCS
jgi:hypothetical protein